MGRLLHSHGPSVMTNVRRTNAALKHVNSCEEISSGRFLLVIMVSTSIIIDFMKEKIDKIIYVISLFQLDIVWTLYHLAIYM